MKDLFNHHLTCVRPKKEIKDKTWLVKHSDWVEPYLFVLGGETEEHKQQ